MKKLALIALLALGATTVPLRAQDAAGGAETAEMVANPNAPGLVTHAPKKGGGIGSVLFGSGPLGFILWLALFGAG
ncbi:MAG: hypothetical protein FWF96_07820, partial [Kiritimatiellaeota bacterium]|nr:hypothetical protein [Kiritimatiellota bacterium]